MQWNDAARSQFESLYSQLAKSDDDSKIVQGVDAMLATLVRYGKAYTLVVPPKLVGVHPQNRGGKGLVGESVHRKGAKIVQVGFSLNKCTPTGQWPSRRGRIGASSATWG